MELIGLLLVFVFGGTAIWFHNRGNDSAFAYYAWLTILVAIAKG
jgi:hypothetical protein